MRRKQRTLSDTDCWQCEGVGYVRPCHSEILKSCLGCDGTGRARAGMDTDAWVPPRPLGSVERAQLSLERRAALEATAQWAARAAALLRELAPRFRWVVPEELERRTNALLAEYDAGKEQNGG